MRLLPEDGTLVVFADDPGAVAVAVFAGLARPAALGGVERGDEDQREQEEHQQQRQEPLELLPQRVGVALLEDALPQGRERDLEAAAPDIEDVGDDRQPGGAGGGVAEGLQRDGRGEVHGPRVT